MRMPLSEFYFNLVFTDFYGIAHEICTLSACHFQANLMKAWGQFNKTFTRVIYKCNHCFRV